MPTPFGAIWPGPTYRDLPVAHETLTLLQIPVLNCALGAIAVTMELVKICSPKRAFSGQFVTQGGPKARAGLLGCMLMAALAASACSSPGARAEGFDDVGEEDRLTVDVATNRQMQIGYQIQSVSASDNALDLCFEMCNRSSESCHLANSVCNIAKRYPKVTALSARCDVTRERCRSHRTKVPRQCPCEQ